MAFAMTMFVANATPIYPPTVRDACIGLLKASNDLSVEMSHYNMSDIIAKKVAIPEILIQKMESFKKADQLLKTFFPGGITMGKLKAALPIGDYLGCMIGCAAINCEYCGGEPLCWLSCYERRERCFANCGSPD